MPHLVEVVSLQTGPEVAKTATLSDAGGIAFDILAPPAVQVARVFAEFLLHRNIFNPDQAVSRTDSVANTIAAFTPGIISPLASDFLKYSIFGGIEQGDANRKARLLRELIIKEGPQLRLVVDNTKPISDSTV